MTGVRFASRVLVLSAVAGCSAGPPDGASRPRVAAHSDARQAILAGELHPDAAHGFDERAENALVLVEHVYFGDCSGTLVSDRVVVTAFHCIVQDMPDWYLGDGTVAPVISGPGAFRVSIGPSRTDRLCEFDVEAVAGHPQAVPEVAGNIIENDVAVLTLTDSVLASCPVARTVPIADDERGAPALGERVLVGGYGATNEAATVLNERRWAELEIQNANVTGTNFISEDVEKGFPMPGDSGGGVFVVTGDGPVLAGISSTVVPPYLAAAKVRSFHAFIVEAAGPAWTECPAPASACADDVTVLRCVDGAVDAAPCADDETCVADEAGASCVALQIGDAIDVDDDDAGPGCTQTNAAGALWMVASVAGLFRRRAGCRRPVA